ncbi:baseplate assembly protein [Schinkia azotoformans]|uniref:baseplate assembly protein n=1 Tax=Schinkia azotoformans TaxID=1454 RepID=UPI002DB84961|nr:baseplate J/gp47 family protein [Schinkia azotoformans]MEC1744109.1 baseplate J/gp47 family protein [Schinkia azotoformans]
MPARFNLTDITFAEKSAQQIEADLISAFESKRGLSLGLADPRRLLLQAIVPILTQQRTKIDFSAKQNLLSYAVGDFLEHVGTSQLVERLKATRAKTTIRFDLTTVNTITIPAGIRVTPGNGVFFMSTKETTIEGVTSVEIEVVCTVPGLIGNGYLPGEINTLVDPLQWVSSVENITVSEGGADVEDDDSYAERIRKAPESYSVAGPLGAYRYWASTANPSIIDVYVGSPAPCVIEIRPLMTGGNSPGQEILDDVLAICSNRTIRPLTDLVQVEAPEQVNYDINLKYWIDSTKASLATAIQQEVLKAIETYKLWQKSKLGRSIDPSEVVALVKNAGAKRVETIAPVYKRIENFQVAKDNQTTIIYGGLEND